MRDVIAVGVSDSTASAVAVRWAMRRAALAGSDIVLVHVLDDEGRSSAGAAERTASVRRLLLRQLRSAQSLSPRSRVEVRSARGSVMWQLAAASGEFDLIVIGTHKTGFIHGSVYGSSSLPLASAAACPVVVVPAPTRADPAGVVLGAEDSVAGRAALEFAAAEAARTDQPLTVVRVSPEPTDEAGYGANPAGEYTADVLLTTFAASAVGAYPALQVHERNMHGSAAHVLVAASAGAQMLVLGDSRTTQSDPSALGAVCHDALINIRVPTAIVHGGDHAPVSTDAAERGAEQPSRAMGAPVLM